MKDPKKPKKILTLNEIVKKTARSHTSIWRARKNKTFPPAFKIGVKAVGVLESDVDEWIENQKNGITKIYD